MRPGPGRRWRRWYAVVGSLALLAAGCSGTAAAARQAEPTTLAGYYAQRLSWHSCDNGFQCATLVVPFDYSRPGWRRFTLPVIELPASHPSERIGALVTNPGGPGGSGVQYVLGARSEFPAAVRARFDIVGFDPRGVGGSVPALRCLTGPQLDQYLAVNDEPANAAQLAAVVSASKQYAARCEANSGDLLPYVGSRNAARDMDVLRAALGEAKLTYLGKSYGTYLGTWYAQLFPRRVRALVLDGAVDPDTSSLAEDVTQAEGFEVAFGSFVAWCVRSGNCPVGAGDAVAVVQGLVSRATATPLANQLNDGQVADGAIVLGGVASALYSTYYWPDLRTGLTNALAGDGTVMVELANLLFERNPNGTYSNLADADTAISCLDRPWPGGPSPRGSRRPPRPGGPPRCSASRSSGAAWPAHTGRCRRTRCPGSWPRARRRSSSSAPCAIPPRRTGRRRRWRATCPPGCCSAGTATGTPPTARAAPAWTRS